MSSLNIDPKAAGGTIAAAIAGLGWFLLFKFGVGDIDAWDPAEVVTATGFTTVIFTAIGAYLPRNGSSAPPTEAIPGGEPVEK